MSLDSFFKAEAKPEPKAEEAAIESAPAPVETESAKADRVRDEAGRFAKGETEKVTAEKPEAKPEAVPPTAKEAKPDKTPEAGLAAGIAAERAKRQEAERRAQEYERRIAEYEARTQAQPAPDPLQDPQGFQRHLQSQVQSVAQQLQQQAMNDRLNMSETIARQAYADLDEVYALFAEEVQANPALAAQAMQQQHPWEWVYQQGKKFQLMREVGSDPDKWRQAERERIKAELQAELTQQPSRPEPSPLPPPSLAAARAGRVSEPVWSGPRPLNSVFKGR